MEVRLIPVGDNPQGALATIDMPEGRCVVYTSHTWSEDFGSLEDLPGVKLPTTDTEAQRAHKIVGWPAPDRVVGPNNLYIVPAPSMPFALRGGFDQSANLPMTDVDIYTVYPGVQDDGRTIPSGTKVRLYGDGAVVTLKSGHYVYNSALRTPGARLEVLNTADDGAGSAGKLSYTANGTIAEVLHFDTTSAALTIRMLGA